MSDASANIEGEERAKRLAPSKKTLRKLFLLSGNECAVRDCDNILIDAKGTMIGDIAHIAAAETGGERFDPDMTNEERRLFANLVLLCGSHHKQIDGKDSGVSVQKLKKIKSKHEKRFSAVEGAIRKRYIRRFADETLSIKSTAPTDFLYYNDWLNSKSVEPLDDETVQELMGEITVYSNKLSVAPIELREFILAVIKRAKLRNLLFDGDVEISCDDISDSLDISKSNMIKFIGSLKEYNLGYDGEIDVSFDQIKWSVVIHSPSDYLPWGEIFDFCEAKNYELKEFVVGVNFNLLG